MKIVKNLVSKTKYWLKCPHKMNPSSFTVHNTGNKAPAKNEVEYMINNWKDISFHFAVDDIDVVQGIPTNRNAWHCGNTTGNRNSLSIEICYSTLGGAKFEKAEQNCAKFLASFFKARGWKIDRLKTHKQFSPNNKDCPHLTLKKGWKRFVKMVQVEMYKLDKPNKKPAVPKVAIKKGDKGKDVIALQKMLNWFIAKKLIDTVPLLEDGVAETLTGKAVKVWKKAAKKKGFYNGKITVTFGTQSIAAATKWLKAVK